MPPGGFLPPDPDAPPNSRVGFSGCSPLSFRGGAGAGEEVDEQDDHAGEDGAPEAFRAPIGLAPVGLVGRVSIGTVGGIFHRTDLLRANSLYSSCRCTSSDAGFSPCGALGTVIECFCSTTSRPVACSRVRGS
jgi:hypothetical protein